MLLGTLDLRRSERWITHTFTNGSPFPPCFRLYRCNVARRPTYLHRNVYICDREHSSSVLKAIWIFLLYMWVSVRPIRLVHSSYNESVCRWIGFGSVCVYFDFVFVRFRCHRKCNSLHRIKLFVLCTEWCTVAQFSIASTMAMDGCMWLLCVDPLGSQRFLRFLENRKSEQMWSNEWTHLLCCA